MITQQLKYQWRNMQPLYCGIYYATWVWLTAINMWKLEMMWKEIISSAASHGFWLVRLSGFLRIIFDIYCIYTHWPSTQSGPKKKCNSMWENIFCFFEVSQPAENYSVHTVYSTLTYCTCTVTGFVCGYCKVCSVVNSVIELFYIGYYR